MKKSVIVVSVFVGFLLFFPLTSSLTQCKNVNIAKIDSGHSLDITLISDFVNNDLLKSQAEALVKEMSNTPPFNEFISKNINIRYVEQSQAEDLGCCQNNLLPFCNQGKVADIASFCPTDEIIVFSNKGNNPSCSNLGISEGGIGAFGQHALILDQNINPRLILHELGHSMAFLGDEYVYEKDFGAESNQVKNAELLQGLSFFNFPNCERNPICATKDAETCFCPKWSNVPGASCIKGCSEKNWYRDSEDSLMKDIELDPSPVDILQLRSAMNRYVDYIKEPASIEIHRKTEDFILQKFIEKNSDWKKLIIPDTNFKESLPELDSPTNSEADFLINNLVKSVISGMTLSLYTCDKYYVKSQGDPKLSVQFKSFNVEHNSNDNSITLTLGMDLMLEGSASVGADEGFIFGINPVEPEQIVKPLRDCNDLVNINWNAKINNIETKAKLYFSDGSLGVLKVRPEIKSISIPAESDINFKIEDSALILGFMLKKVTEVLDENQFSKSYNFASTLRSDIRSFTGELNDNLDELAFSLKASLDNLGLEQLGGMGKPHGMITGLSLVNSANSAGGTITHGAEVDSKEQSLRLSGFLSMNKPLLNNRASCVNGLSLNFNPINYDGFNRVNGNSGSSFASIKLSQTFTNWFIATLWNDGYFCAQRNINIADHPELLPNVEPFHINSISYILTPLSPPYMNYNLIKDRNHDGKTDIRNDLAAEGDAKIDLKINYQLGQEIPKDEAIPLNVHYTIPLILEEPDITLPSDQGFSSAQSFFKPDSDNTEIILQPIQCNQNSLFCISIRDNPLYTQMLIQAIKEEIVPHVDRGIQDIAFNPVRNVNLNFGSVGEKYFSPPINLNYGYYIFKVQQRNINGNWMTYDFNLVEQCGKDENCGVPDHAHISSIQEVFYKDLADCSLIPYSERAQNGCRCINQQTEESRECVDALRMADGNLHQYVKINYFSNDYVSYNFNLVSWSTYLTKPGKIYSFYVTPSYETYQRLINSRSSGNADLELIDKEASIHTFTSDATQIVAFRARTPKGVEQNLECMAAVVFDRAPDMLSYAIKPVYATINSNTRLDIRDSYHICAQEYVYGQDSGLITGSRGE